MTTKSTTTTTKSTTRKRRTRKAPVKLQAVPAPAADPLQGKADPVQAAPAAPVKAKSKGKAKSKATKAPVDPMAPLAHKATIHGTAYRAFVNPWDTPKSFAPLTVNAGAGSAFVGAMLGAAERIALVCNAALPILWEAGPRKGKAPTVAAEDLIVQTAPYWFGTDLTPQNATRLWNGGRARIGLGQFTHEGAQQIDATLPNGVLASSEATAIELYELGIQAAALLARCKVTDSGKARERRHPIWTKIAPLFGIEYTTLDRGTRDPFGRSHGVTFDPSKGAALQVPDGPIAPVLPKGTTWEAEADRIKRKGKANGSTGKGGKGKGKGAKGAKGADGDARSLPDGFLACVCPDCAKGAPGDTPEARTVNATRYLSAALIESDPFAASCRHRRTFRVVQDSKGNARAESIPLSDRAAEIATIQAAWAAEATKAQKGA